MRLILDVYLKDEGRVQKWMCDHWIVSEFGQLIIERIIDGSKYKTIVPNGEWSYLVEHPV